MQTAAVHASELPRSAYSFSARPGAPDVDGAAHALQLYGFCGKLGIFRIPTWVQ